MLLSVHSLLLMAVGYVAGAFTPGIGRKIKALFVKEASKGTAVVEKKLGV